MKKYFIAILIFVFVVSAFATKRPVEFRFTANVVPQSVALAGSFNNWSTTTDYLSDPDGDGTWTIKLELEDGEYQYKFVVNGSQWLQDFNNPQSAPDGFGGRNSQIWVGDYGKFQLPAYRGDGKILEEALHHEMGYPYFVFTDVATLWLKFRTKYEDVDSVILIFNDERHKLDWYAFDGTFDFYIAQAKTSRAKHNAFEYKFIVYDGSKMLEYGEHFTGRAIDFNVFAIPSWVQASVFYQIFPERFANGDLSNDPKNVHEWDNTPQPDNFFGGDLKGVLDHLDYLADLGVDAIYFNPIFVAPSNHKYDMSDPMNIDPHFGDLELFKTLLAECKSRGIKIVLDMVYHDTGREHWAFQDVIKNEEKSPYRSWYNVHSFPVAPIDKPNYECWWGCGALPSLMTTNPDVRAYLFKVTRFWTELGIDGWRLDCPNEVEDEFWQDFRDSIHSINPNCYIVGEIWSDASKWLKGDMFDATMNYRFRDACLDFFALDKIYSEEFAEKYFAMLASYPPNVNFTSFNLLGSHDTPRFLTFCGDDKQKLKLAWLFQMTMIGAPSIYYGDEIGLNGGKDPDCRKCFIWDTLAQDRDLLNYMKQLIIMRNKYPVFTQGNIFRFEIPNHDCIIFYKKYQDNIAVILLNRSSQEIKQILKFPRRYYEDAMTGQTAIIEGDEYPIIVPPKSGRVIMMKE